MLDKYLRLLLMYNRKLFSELVQYSSLSACHIYRVDAYRIHTVIHVCNHAISCQ